jgi:isopentenyl phosphate kinase
MPAETVFLKLGGSLITDKSRARTAREDVIRRLATEIAQARGENGALRIVLGHGSGSFGHSEARQHGTAAGVRTAEEWRGFVSVWAAADRLNRIVMDALAAAGVPVVRIAPSGCALLEEGVLVEMPAGPVAAATAAGIVPVVYGDAVFDRKRGGGIASTERVFAQLARALHPRRILLAGLEAGVYSDFPANKKLIPEIRAAERGQVNHSLNASAHPDVTGGMQAKVSDMLDLLAAGGAAEVTIFSGEAAGNVQRALLGESVAGTRLIK